jgi:predicted dehydrogenase
MISAETDESVTAGPGASSQVLAPARPAGLAVALVGAGFMGRVHARAALVNGARLVGVSGSTPERALSAATALGASRAYRSVEELIADPDVELVHICTPNHLHADVARDVIEAGKHVICEKPLATSLLDAQALQQLAESRSVVATVPYIYRYFSMVQEARIRAQQGDLGAVGTVHGSYLQDWLTGANDTNWRVDPTLGGPSRAFADIGSHWCDLAEFITGDRIDRVSSAFQIIQRRRPDPRDAGSTFSACAPSVPADGGAAGSGMGAGSGVSVDTEDAAIVQFHTSGGALGSVVVSQVAFGHKNHLHIEILGDQKSLTFDTARPEVLRMGDGAGSRVIERDPARLSSGAARYSRLPAGHPQGYQDCVDSFVADTYDAVRSGHVDPVLPTFASGVRAAAVTEAVVRSARQGGWVSVADLDTVAGS